MCRNSRLVGVSGRVRSDEGDDGFVYPAKSLI